MYEERNLGELTVTSSSPSGYLIFSLCARTLLQSFSQSKSTSIIPINFIQDQPGKMSSRRVVEYFKVSLYSKAAAAQIRFLSIETTELHSRTETTGLLALAAYCTPFNSRDQLKSQ